MIKVSYLVSYDYQMFFTSVKQLYNYVDKIVVAIDSERKTWSGNTFHIPESFFNEVKEFDVKNKIQFYFDEFYLAELTPMENETRERNMTLAKLGRGWKIQLDVDEYVYEFHTVVKYLKKYWFLTLFPKFTPLCLKGKLVTLYRELPDGYLYIENNEQFPFITNQNNNTHTRNNSKIRNFQTNIKVIHQSWARSEDDILIKIKNWGHRDDFDTMKYFQFWRSLNSNNFKDIVNFHPISPEVWNKISYLPCNDIHEFIREYSKNIEQDLILFPIKKIFKSAVKKILGKE